MNTILIILIIAVAILYLKWFFAILFYPLMALSALGSRQSTPKIKKIMRFPLRVAEHFLRFGGADSCSFKFLPSHPYICVYGCIRDWV